MSAPRPGFVLGVAGGGLEVANAGWAANADVARVGRTGELRTATVLDAIAHRPGGPTVLHDLTIPGSRANVDHVIVSGRRVLLIDSKSWKGARYWTVAGRTRRGWERFPYADKDTMAWAQEQLQRALAQARVRHSMARPVTMVWSSSPRVPVKLLLARVPGSRLLAAERVASRPSVLGRFRPGAPDVVAVLARMCAAPAAPVVGLHAPAGRETSLVDDAAA